MKYTIVTAATSEELAAAISGLIAEGWKPIGGIATGNDKYSQALLSGDTKAEHEKLLRTQNRLLMKLLNRQGVSRQELIDLHSQESDAFWKALS